MKCPKCQYLGFETGDRCRNCGYDFSLASAPAASAPADLPLRAPDAAESGPARWCAEIDNALTTTSTLPRGPAHPLTSLPLDTVAASTAAAVRSAVARTAEGTPTRAARTAPPLPLFARADADDEPLIKVPPAPRAPLAVRRTPDKPRLRAGAKPPGEASQEPAKVAPAVSEPIFDLPDDPAGEAHVERHAHATVSVGRRAPAAAGGPVRRLLAALLDHTMLGVVDVAVGYLTLKVAGLSPDQWMVLPVVPLLAFLLMVKAAYFCAFTLVGGQTIGKMAFGIRVVSDDGGEVDPACAVRRTLAGGLSLAMLGLGFAPALLAVDRRALHDRVARTRVVAS